MKEWGSDPNEKPDGRLRLEGVGLATCVVVTYVMIAYHLAT